MKKAELDALTVEQIMDLPDDTEIEDFDKERWRSVWFAAVEIWWHDDLYSVMRDGFKGFLQRSAFDIYSDLRFTYIDGSEMTWEEVAAENDELGKYS